MRGHGRLSSFANRSTSAPGVCRRWTLPDPSMSRNAKRHPALHLDGGFFRINSACDQQLACTLNWQRSQ